MVAKPAWAAHTCVEQSDVVGEERCSRYGDRWAIERQFPITFRFGFRYGEVGPQGHTFSESYKKGQRPKNYVGYRFPGAALGTPLTAGGGDGGVGFFVWDQLYTGIEGGLLFGSATTRPVTTSTFYLSNDRGVDVMLLHAGIPIGYRIPLGRFSLRGEALFGGTIVEISQRARAVGETKSDTRSSTAAIWLIEPRIAADVWFTQHMSASFYGGANLLDSDGRALGIALTFHERSFDGDAALW